LELLICFYQSPGFVTNNFLFVCFGHPLNGYFNIFFDYHKKKINIKDIVKNKLCYLLTEYFLKNISEICPKISIFSFEELKDNI
jgi:hypothetical protein